MCEAVTSLDFKSQWCANHEETLIRRCQAGDWADYGELVYRYKKLVWAAIDAVVDDKSCIPDLVQDAFIRVYEKLHTFSFKAKFSSWLFRIARNIGLNYLRKRSRRPRYDSLEQNENLGSSKTNHFEDNPAINYASGNRMLVLEQMLMKLPEKYRVVINMYYVHEYSYTDLAEATGLPLNTVRTRLRRGRARLLEISRKEGYRK